MAMTAYDKLHYTWNVHYVRGSGATQISRLYARHTLSDIYTKHGNYRTPNRHSYSVMKTRGWVGTKSYYVQGRLQESDAGSYGSPYNASTHMPTTYNSDALSMALGKAYDALRGSVDLSVDLVQWRQTLKMISLYRRLVSGIATSALRLIPRVDKIKSLRRDLTDPQLGKRRARRLMRELNRATNQLARARLEYTYGWSPTMSSLYDVALMAVTPPDGGLMVCEGKGKVISRKLVRTNELSSYRKTEHFIQVSDRARVKLLYNPPNSIMTNLSKISSLNPVSILYEVIPFSFVLDWAVDVGGWIRTMETAFVHRNDFIRGDQTLTQRVVLNSLMQGLSYTSSVALSQGTFTMWGLQGLAVRTRLNRSGLSTPPYPVNPVKQFKFGVGRQLNALALAKVVLLDADDLLASRRR